jgi:hypothetical protein
VALRIGEGDPADRSLPFGDQAIRHAISPW